MHFRSNSQKQQQPRLLQSTSCQVTLLLGKHGNPHRLKSSPGLQERGGGKVLRIPSILPSSKRAEIWPMCSNANFINSEVILYNIFTSVYFSYFIFLLVLERWVSCTSWWLTWWGRDYNTQKVKVELKWESQKTCLGFKKASPGAMIASDMLRPLFQLRERSQGEGGG